MMAAPAVRDGHPATTHRRPPLLPRAVVWLMSCCLSVDSASACDPRPEWRIEPAGSLVFPDEATATDGTHQPVRGLSGLTWLGDDRWVAIMDNSDQLVTFTLELSADAVPLAVRDVRLVQLSTRHDYEDVAVCPPALAARYSPQPRRGRPAVADLHLLLCEEDTPAVHVMRFTDGRLVGTLPVPPPFETRRPNRGFEALAVDLIGGFVWTANEEALAVDGPPPSETVGTVVRLLGLPLGGSPPRHVAYAVDPPHPFLRLREGPVFSGVVAIVPLPDGRLLVFERSAGPGLPPFESRIHLVDWRSAPPVEAGAVGLASRRDLHVAKQLLWKGGLGANLEGLAAGPTAPDGRRTLVAISDNDGLGTSSVLVGFRLSAVPDVTSP